MVVTHRETSISSNIRAIIEQLKLNPVERRRLIDKNKQETNARCTSFPSAKISIGVYGCSDKLDVPTPMKRPEVLRKSVQVENRRRSVEIVNDGVGRGDVARATLAEKPVDEKRQKVADRSSEMAKEIRKPPEVRRRTKIRPRSEEIFRSCELREAGKCESRKMERPKIVEDGARCETEVPTKPEVVRQKLKIDCTKTDSAESIQPDCCLEVVSKSTKDHAHRVSGSKEELPELETKTLNHTAAHHRISVRPRNRRPPRRAAPATTITTINEDNLDSLENVGAPMAASSAASSPTEPKKVSRKSSSRLSRNSEIFDELESKLPRKPSSVASLSPDSLDATIASRSSVETSEEQIEIRPVARKLSNRISKGSDVFEELESKLPRRRSSNRLSKSPDSLESPGSWFSKSTEGFDKLVEHEESRPTYRRSLNPISKSTDRVSKSSDSLEVLETLASDDSIERRRSSFESRARKASKLMSKSTESFETMEQQAQVHHDNRGIITDVNFTGQEPLNRGSITDISIRTRRLSTSGSKSSDSFEIVDVNECCKDAEDEDEASSCPRRSSKRMSSESSDNLDLDDRLENRRVRRLPKRVPSTSIVDIVPVDDPDEEKRPTPLRKPSRLQKSSESSELGSTDTLDSDRKNKSTGSTETLDSLERDLEQDRKDEDITENILDRREKNDSWVKNTSSESNRTSMTERTEDSKVSSDKSYWRQSSESKENLDIHQLLAITTIVTRMNDNGNNQRSPVIYARKKQQISASPPTSPVAKQDDNNLVFDNLLTTKNDEDLQNMLNGNISSEVSSTTDTKSFKEKLIMFEKLGK
ncbi:dentin sialophosphoprotein-like isoform X8 [Prorops nasuta]